MKTKLIITGLVLILSGLFFSFKKIGEKESCNSALVNAAFGKEENEGFLIQYGDGSSEIVKFNFKNKTENLTEQLSVMAQIIHKLHEKGYHYSGMGTHVSNDVNYLSLSYLIFEKK